MPDDKRNQKRSDAKEQRKPRRGRQHEAPINKHSEVQEVYKVTVPHQPVYEDPGPEFYKSLKRETDDIMKITEEESSKYKKKEIQSNWSKYEMPIESYEEIEEQEMLGADYEKLIEAPLSVGGHFQFKHEKSWDVTSGPSPYDKYFEINMENLCLAISTIPFYERNPIEMSIYNKSDMLSMNNRATKYKQKYFNDNSFATPEIEAQEKILNNLKDNRHDHTSEVELQENILYNLKENYDRNEDRGVDKDRESIVSDSTINNNLLMKTEIPKEIELNNDFGNKNEQYSSQEKGNISMDNDQKDINMFHIKQNKTQDFIVETAESILITTEKKEGPIILEIQENPKVAQSLQNETNKPSVESPEDLEKWLDDFLDG